MVTNIGNSKVLRVLICKECRCNTDFAGEVCLLGKIECMSSVGIIKHGLGLGMGRNNCFFIFIATSLARLRVSLLPWTRPGLRWLKGQIWTEEWAFVAWEVRPFNVAVGC